MESYKASSCYGTSHTYLFSQWTSWVVDQVNRTARGIQMWFISRKQSVLCNKRLHKKVKNKIWSPLERRTWLRLPRSIYSITKHQWLSVSRKALRRMTLGCPDNARQHENSLLTRSSSRSPSNTFFFMHLIAATVALSCLEYFNS